MQDCETKWPMRLDEPRYPYAMDEAMAASDAWGFNCGPAALATMLGMKPEQVRPHMGQFEDRGYTNPSMMQAALISLRVGYREMDDAADRDDLPEFPRMPAYGLVRVQWDGPWMAVGVPIAARYTHTHWIGTMIRGTDTWIFDINSGWCRYLDWADVTVRFICSHIKRSTGRWSPTHRWELSL